MYWVWVNPLVIFSIVQITAAQGQRPPDVIVPDQIPNGAYFNTANFTDSQQLRNLDTVFEFLIGNTPPNGYATSLGYGDDYLRLVFGHTACYNMSDQPSCSDCLRGGYSFARQRLVLGFRLWRNRTDLRCNIQYEVTNFTRSLPPETLGVLGPNASVSTQSPTPAPGPLPAPRSNNNIPPGPSGSSSNNTPAIAGAVAGTVCVILVIGGCCLWKRRKHRRLPDDDILGSSRGPVVFTYRELSSATKNFSEQNKLGQGGFGAVHKAQLADGIQVAVKQLSIGSHQGMREFANEINVITSIQHRNLAKLIGYCAEGNHRLLVYEFLENSSLDRALFKNHKTLDWQTRVQIVVGVAKGIAYLHEESHVQIIHRDIKASNVLLDKNLQPKISDFGISKIEDAMNEGGTTTTTRVAGTLGYMAPEYVSRGRLTAKADVFSFGTLVLEIISGRTCMDSSLPADEEILLQKTWTLYTGNRIEELVDPRLEKNYDVEEAHRLVHVALFCTQEYEENRPVMSQVVAMLMGFLEIPLLSELQTPNFFGQLANLQRGWTSTSTSNTGGTRNESSTASSQSVSASVLHGR